MKSIFDSQLTFFIQIMTLSNIELSMTLGSPVFDPYRFPCSPQAVACIASWNSPRDHLYLHPSRPFWTHIDLFHAWNLLYQFESTIQFHMQAFQCETTYMHELLSHSRVSCFASFDNQNSLHMTSLSNLRLCTSILSCLIGNSFACHFESHISQQASTNIRALISIMNVLLSIFLSQSSLLHSSNANEIFTFACSTWAISIHINS